MADDTPELAVAHTSTVTEDQIDHLGHMNVRYYAANATTASDNLRSTLGIDDDVEMTRVYTRHHNEQMLGSPLAVLSGRVLGSERAQLYHELRNTDTNALAATFVHDFDHPAAGIAASGELPELRELPPHGRPRSLSLHSDAVAAAPSLADIRDRDIAVRLPRIITTEDSGGADEVPAERRSHLIWDGEPAKDRDRAFLKRGPNGELIGYATMESQLQLVQIPRVGMEIQSFGAVTSLGEKVYTRAMWVFDLKTEHLLVTFEIVNLCFNIDERRSMVIPDEMRREEERWLHPDLAVT